MCTIEKRIENSFPKFQEKIYH